MKKRLINGGVLTAVFIAAVIVFSYLTNRGNNNMTADIGAPSLPVLSFDCEGYEVNYLNGYTKQMDVTAMRDSITPVDGRTLELHTQAYDSDVEKLEYTVRSLDGQEEMYRGTVSGPQETEKLVFEDCDLSEERLLELTLTVGGEEVCYYTRIVDAADLSIPECLDYVSRYHENALGKVENVGVGAALEQTEEADGFAHLDIRSDYDHVTWGNLEPSVEGTQRWKIAETNATCTSVLLEYQVRCAGEENEQDLYNVKEFFRVRNVSGTMYLLDYDRTMEQIFDGTANVLSDKGILLGITGADVPYLVNSDGTRTAFVQADELWYYNQEGDELSLLFSFRDAESEDLRNLTDQHEIRLISMEKSGDVIFAVYGYMNRGDHEGEVGAAVYYYSAEQNCVDEKAFIAADTSAGIASEDLEELLYYSPSRNMLYASSGGALYEVNLTEGEQSVLTKNLEDGQCAASEDGSMVAYVSGDAKAGNGTVTVKDLDTGEAYEVQAEEGEAIRPLGFVNSDFVCGMSKEDDAGKTVSGEPVTPMYKVEIRSEDNEVVRTYQSENDYVLGAQIDGNMINLNRAVKAQGVYKEIADNQITSNEEKKESNIYLESYSTELKGVQMRLTFADGIADRYPKVLKPKQILYEQPRSISFEGGEAKERFYVYGLGGFQGGYSVAGEAVSRADEIGGVVVSAQQEYVWERGNRYLEYELPQSDETAKDLQTQLKDGKKTPVDAIKAVTGKDALDFTGCTTEEMLYVVNRGTPVIGTTGKGEHVILIGYSEKYVTYLEAASGNRKVISHEQMDGMLEGTGRTFTGYLP